ncbi:hypothetical protein M0805_003663 [Coniferiporia weirii]|nr:hypothetical protein M0805_003663 [Coniferiporia weirii]
MLSALSLSFALLASQLTPASAYTESPLSKYLSAYALSDVYSGPSFLSGFVFETDPDPTHGRVNYVDSSRALSEGLIDASRPGTFVMRADATTVLDPNGPGRDSIRIRSVKEYTSHVAVFDIRHMPQGCGTWPAAWETGESDWPALGEVDILEGVNDQGPNAMTLHTSANCTMPDNRAMKGTPVLTNCDGSTNGNAGCSVHSGLTTSYGPAFNAAGGGWFALERTSTFLRVFFWSRSDSGSVPPEVKYGAPAVDPGTWGTPDALFPNTQCDIPSHFGGNNIIFDLTFCGDWAGDQTVYSAAGCPGTCVDYVNNNPTAFKDAYWDVAAVRVYTPVG